MLRILYSVFALLAVANAGYTDCGSETGTLTSVSVTGCDMSEAVCVLKRGTDIDFGFSFTALFNTSTATASVHGIIGGVPLPFPLTQRNACVNSGLVCPLANNKSYNYSTNFSILSGYPSVSVTVKWELLDDDEKDIVCIELPAKIE